MNNGILFIRTSRREKKKQASRAWEEFSPKGVPPPPPPSIFRSVFQQRFISTAQLGTVKGTQKHISRTVDYLRINRLFVSYRERGNMEARNFQLFHKAAWPIRSQFATEQFLPPSQNSRDPVFILINTLQGFRTRGNEGSPISRPDNESIDN